MRYSSARDSNILSNAAMGPAAYAAKARNSQLINMGIFTRSPRASILTQGGSAGAINLQPRNTNLVRTGLGSVAYAEQGASVGGTAGSVAGPIGTVIGTIAGAIVGMIAHQGQGPQRAAAAAQIDQALSQMLPASSAGIGVQIPWIGSSTSPGLQQFLQALMTSGVYMSWDPSLISSPAVNGNWANTFIAAVKQVVAAIIANPTGKQVSVNVSDAPGGNNEVAGNFNFVNPGLSIGPDAISQTIIMGNGGLMYWMVLRTGESIAHAGANGNNTAAQKVFALMVDHAAHDIAPQLFVVPPPAATIATVANSAAAVAVPTVPPAISTPQPIPYNSAQITPVAPVQAPSIINLPPVVAPVAASSFMTSTAADGTPTIAYNPNVATAGTLVPGAAPALDLSSLLPWIIGAGVLFYFLSSKSTQAPAPAA
jgi:hypothetical protein